MSDAAQEVMNKTPDELVSWAFERASDVSFRQSIVKLEFERRVAIAQLETAKSTKSSSKWMLCSVIVLALTLVVAVVALFKGSCPNGGLSATIQMPCTGSNLEPMEKEPP
jgi:hypothetical protein